MQFYFYVVQVKLVSADSQMMPVYLLEYNVHHSIPIYKDHSVLSADFFVLLRTQLNDKFTGKKTHHINRNLLNLKVSQRNCSPCDFTSISSM